MMKTIKVIGTKPMSNFGGICISEIDDRNETITFFESYGEKITKPKTVRLYCNSRGFYFNRYGRRENLNEYMRTNNFEINYDQKTLEIIKEV